MNYFRFFYVDNRLWHWFSVGIELIPPDVVQSPNKIRDRYYIRIEFGKIYLFDHGYFGYTLYFPDLGNNSIETWILVNGYFQPQTVCLFTIFSAKSCIRKLNLFF